LTTTLFCTVRLFTILVLLTMTLVRETGTILGPMRGARKSWHDTKVKLAATGAPKPADTPTEKPGDTGAQPT